MSLSQPIRTLLLAGILITTAVVVRNYFESDLPAPAVDEDLALPVIRVARDDQPTIVESNEDWLEARRGDPMPEDSSPLTPSHVPLLPRVAPADETAPTDSVLIR